MKKKIAIMGSGALATIIGERLVRTDLKDAYEITGVYSPNYKHAATLARRCRSIPCKNMEELLKEKPDYVLEAATSDAVKLYGKSILRNGSHLILISTGALAEEEFYQELYSTAWKHEKKVYLVSGAIGGLDLMLSMKEMGGVISRISSSKAPGSLNGAPYLEGRELPEDKEICLFSGNAKDAIKGFPKNVNVAVSTALVTEGIEKTQVEIHSVPGKETNEHQITLENHLVKAKVTVESAKDPGNPKSSVLTAYSAVALLRNLISPVCFF